MARQRLYFPDQRSWVSTTGRCTVGLGFLAVGVGAVTATVLGQPLQWSDGPSLPLWGSILIGLAFAAAGMLMLARREHAVIDVDVGRVKAWRDPQATFRTAFPLNGFETIRVRPWPEDASDPEGYTLWLEGPSGEAFLQAFESRNEVLRRAKTIASVLELPFTGPGHDS